MEYGERFEPDDILTWTNRGTVSAGLLGAEIDEGQSIELLKERRLLEIERRIIAIEELLAAAQSK